MNPQVVAAVIAENRQTCVDVLCGYLRMPYEPDPGGEAAPADQAAYRANREVRHSLIRLIGAHLRAEAPVSWQGLNLDFTGMVFDGGDFGGTRFTGGEASFRDARFTSGTVSFYGAEPDALEFDPAVLEGQTPGTDSPGPREGQGTAG